MSKCNWRNMLILDLWKSTVECTTNIVFTSGIYQLKRESWKIRERETERERGTDIKRGRERKRDSYKEGEGDIERHVERGGGREAICCYTFIQLDLKISNRRRSKSSFSFRFETSTKLLFGTFPKFGSNVNSELKKSLKCSFKTFWWVASFLQIKIQALKF